MIVIGEVTALEAQTDKATGEVWSYDMLIRQPRGGRTLYVRLRQASEDGLPYPAWEQYRAGLFRVGKRVALRVGVTARASNGRAFINYVAIGAEAVGDDPLSWATFFGAGQSPVAEAEGVLAHGPIGPSNGTAEA